MKNILITFLAVVTITPLILCGQQLDGKYDKILTSAESFFRTMKGRQYPKIWSLLTTTSQNIIIADVQKAETAAGKKYSRDDINQDFITAGVLSKSYWNNYLTAFNPDIVLEKSKWEMGKVEKEKAEIIIKYHKSDRPAQLKMVKENGAWKVGLEETFRSSRR
jgi:hypothetical protein